MVEADNIKAVTNVTDVFLDIDETKSENPSCELWSSHVTRLRPSVLGELWSPRVLAHALLKSSGMLSQNNPRTLV